MSGIGILAYGSLMSNPGTEIGPLVTRRIRTTTPFPVEYAHLSRTRGGAPTVVPHRSGNPVKAEVLVLSDSIGLSQAKSMLWRRETRREGSRQAYSESVSPNAVVIRDEQGFCGLDHALYTDFNPSGKLKDPDARELAKAAIESVREAEAAEDGISYLMGLISWGVMTPLTARYQEEILALTGSSSLAEALASVKAKKHVD